MKSYFDNWFTVVASHDKLTLEEPHYTTAPCGDAICDGKLVRVLLYV